MKNSSKHNIKDTSNTKLPYIAHNTHKPNVFPSIRPQVTTKHMNQLKNRQNLVWGNEIMIWDTLIHVSFQQINTKNDRLRLK